MLIKWHLLRCRWHTIPCWPSFLCLGRDSLPRVRFSGEKTNSTIVSFTEYFGPVGFFGTRDLTPWRSMSEAHRFTEEQWLHERASGLAKGLGERITEDFPSKIIPLLRQNSIQSIEYYTSRLGIGSFCVFFSKTDLQRSILDYDKILVIVKKKGPDGVRTVKE